MSRELRILLLAGEESGVLYARRLKEALARAAGGRRVVFRGYDTEGFKTGDLAVMGFGPVLRRLFYFLGVARTLKRVIRDWRPDVVVTVDYPGLNLKLAAYAKARGIPAVHLVCPQVWAWRRGRIPKVAAALTKLLCFFPFEPALFAGTGLDARFIGHPLVDVCAREADGGRGAAGDGAKLLALLPGSRLGEIRRNLPRLLRALPLLAVDGVRVVVPAANERAEREIRRLVAEAPRGAGPVAVQAGGARALLRRATCAAVASGTATLEAALARCPTVLVYAVSPLLAWFARRVVTGVHFIGLANVIWEKGGGRGEPPMPELLQEAFTPEAVAARLAPLLADAAARAAAVRRLDEATAPLRAVGAGDALGRAAREILASAAARREKTPAPSRADTDRAAGGW